VPTFTFFRDRSRARLATSSDTSSARRTVIWMWKLAPKSCGYVRGKAYPQKSYCVLGFAYPGSRIQGSVSRARTRVSVSTSAGAPGPYPPGPRPLGGGATPTPTPTPTPRGGAPPNDATPARPEIKSGNVTKRLQERSGRAFLKCGTYLYS
jgi:hypothetical protein